MKKLTIFLLAVALLSIIFSVIFYFKFDKKENEIIMLKKKIKEDSAAFEKFKLEAKWKFMFEAIGVRVIPQRNIIPLGDSIKAQIILSAFDMAKNGERTKKPFIAIGKDIDTIKWEIIGKADTLKQNNWNPIITKKTTKLGKDSIAGIFYIPNPHKDKMMKFTFKYYFTVVERDLYKKIAK